MIWPIDASPEDSVNILPRPEGRDSISRWKERELKFAVLAARAQPATFRADGGELPRHANALANTIDNSREVKRRSLPSLKAGVATPRPL